ncbi:MAG: SpoIIE family protein phosphatase [Bacteroidetes bacterium]|nr:SpoIIE family protein phosphatase [Bacteroidota bacterium]
MLNHLSKLISFKTNSSKAGLNGINSSTLNHLLEGFQLISYDYKYLYVNDTVVKQSKFSRKELVGFTMMEKYPGIENTEMFRILSECMTNRSSKQIENEFHYPDGSTDWFELHMQPVPEGVFILSIDISKRKRAEKELMEMNERLEEMVEMRTKQLEIKNKDITDSLNYAKNIQKAFLPNKSDLHTLLPDSMILYKPKDIVSGDFYWFREQNSNVLIAAADCTGHGVPGALVSMIGIEKLDNSALKSLEPSEILKNLNQGIKIALSQSDIYAHTHDGMDIALCCFDKKKHLLHFSGASRPLWIIRKGEHKIEEIKSNCNSIGGFNKECICFENHTVQLHQGDTFYIFSDGFADTFSGITGKKLTTKKFKELLLSIQHLTMPEQKKHLNLFIENWKAGIEAIDDILVIGVRV